MPSQMTNYDANPVDLDRPTLNRQYGSTVTVGYFDDSRGRGGTTRYLIELIKNLDRRRFQPVFFSPRPCNWHRDLMALGVRIVGDGYDDPFDATPSPAPENRVDTADHDGYRAGLAAARLWRGLVPASVRWSAGLYAEVRTLASLFRRYPVDILHTNNAGAEAAPLAARLAGVPRVVGTMHVDPSYDLHGERQSLRYRLLERANLTSLDSIIAVSQATADAWIDRCRPAESTRRRFDVIYNGVDFENIHRDHSPDEARALCRLPQGTLVIGSVGRLEPAKGYEYLLRAAAKLDLAARGAVVVIAGDGPDLDKLKALASALKIHHGVRFQGFVTDVRLFMECLDLYVQSSLCEALPFSVLDAAAIGLPMVATAVGGVPEAVDSGRTGYIVPPRDIDALAAAIDMLLVDNDARVRFSRSAKERVLLQFTSAQMAARTMSVYDALAPSDGRRSAQDFLVGLPGSTN